MASLSRYNLQEDSFNLRLMRSLCFKWRSYNSSTWNWLRGADLLVNSSTYLPCTGARMWWPFGWLACPKGRRISCTCVSGYAFFWLKGKLTISSLTRRRVIKGARTSPTSDNIEFYILPAARGRQSRSEATSHLTWNLKLQSSLVEHVRTGWTIFRTI